jgi:hypothetical protein
MSSRRIAILAMLTISLCRFGLPTLLGQNTVPSSLPAGRIPKHAPLEVATRKSLPPGSTQVAPPVAVALGPLRSVRIVLYRRGDRDKHFRGLALLPTARGYRALPLPDQDQAIEDGDEEVTTSILAADIPPPGAIHRALVILYYTHRPEQPESIAFGRVYRYDHGSFHIDPARSSLL